MQKNTLVAMGACLVTLAVLGGIVMWAESRLSSHAKAAAQQELKTVKQHRDALAAARKRIAIAIKQNEALLGQIAREESWVELFDLTITEIAAAEKEYRATIDPILAKNSKDDERALFLAIEELENKSQAAEKRVAGLEQRIKQLADVLKRADTMRVAEGKALAKANDAVAEARKTMSTLEAKYGDEFKALVKKERWPEHLDREAKVLAEVQTAFDGEVQPLIRKTKAEEARKAIAILQRLSAKRARAEGEAKVFLTALRALKDFIDNKARYMQQAKDDLARVEKVDLRSAQDAASKAALEFKRVEARVKRDLAIMEQMPATARRLAAEVEKQGTMKLTDPGFSPGRVVSDLKQLSELSNTATSRVDAFLKLLEQLYVSWDKILSDLRIEEGQYVVFRVQYTIHRVDKNDRKTTKVEPWKKIDAKTYKKLEPQMGMVVESKPKGYFDAEAKKGVIPPGYTYVDNPHYGKWEQRGGQRVWIFHSRYHYMRPLFWGSYYRPIRYAHWSSWRAHPGRPYYGRDRFGHVRYGPRGSLTRRHYSGALFVRHGGWRTTRWYRTGGKFRGTYYERRSRPRTTVVYGSGGGPRYRGSSSSGRSYGGYRRYGK